MHEIELLNALREDDRLLTMLAEEIGEEAVRLHEAEDEDETWQTIGHRAVTRLLAYSMVRS